MQKFGPHAALGTMWWVELYEVVYDDVFASLAQLIDKFEADYSRFKPDSLVGRLNKRETIASNSAELLDMLLYGQEQYRTSGGVFNVLTGGKQIAAGYGQSFDGEVVEVANPLIDLRLGEEIQLGKGSLDLGGFGKGWLIDMIAHQLQAAGYKHFLINGGGDMYATCEADGSPVVVYVEHPVIEGMYLAQIPLQNQSLAVSSTFKRQWKKAGDIYNHLHVDEIASHVVAQTALQADTVATRLCLGVDIVGEDVEYLLWRAGQAKCSGQFKTWLLSG